MHRFHCIHMYILNMLFYLNVFCFFICIFCLNLNIMVEYNSLKNFDI